MRPTSSVVPAPVFCWTASIVVACTTLAAESQVTFSGMLAGLFRWMTASYVQNGLDTNTVALKALAERD